MTHARSPSLWLFVTFSVLSTVACVPWLSRAQEADPEFAAGGGEEIEVQEIPVDTRLSDTLRSRLSKIGSLKNVDVSVEGGVVILFGEVEDSDARALAGEVVRSESGVLDVRNEIVLGGEVGERVSNAFARSRLKLRMMIGYLPIFLVAVAVIFVSAFLARVIATPKLASRLVGRNRFLVDVARQAIRFAIILVGILIALDLLDATALVGAVFGAAGLAGLAIGFAFKDLIENYVASILLSVRRPFRPNDHVVIDGNEGLVVSLNTRATTLMTLDGNHLRLPNALVFKSVMLNYTRNSERRFDFSVGVGVNEDLALAQEIGIATLRSMKGVLDDPPPLALVTDLADSSVTIQFLAWVDQNQASFGKVKGEAIRLVKIALENAGMDLPEPIYRVHLSSPLADVDLAESPPKKTVQPAKLPANQGDISVDNHLKRQIAEDGELTKSSNLLTEEAPPE